MRCAAIARAEAHTARLALIYALLVASEHIAIERAFSALPMPSPHQGEPLPGTVLAVPAAQVLSRQRHAMLLPRCDASPCTTGPNGLK